MPRNLNGSVALSKVKHVLMTCKNSKKEEIKGMFIPFEANKLTIIEKKGDPANPEKVTEVQVYMPVRVHVKDEEDQNSQIGFISKSLSTEDYKALGTGDTAKEAAKEFTPILGGLKEFTNSGSSNDADGAVASGQTFEPTDDVPF